MLWHDVVGLQKTPIEKKLGRFPYLGPRFEFLEKVPGLAPYLKNIHCFNYAAALSHGLISEDIAGISVGAQRLAEGIAADLFVEDADRHLAHLKKYNETDLTPETFAWLIDK